VTLGIIGGEPAERRRPECAGHEQADRPRDEQRQQHEHDTNHRVDVRPAGVEALVSELRQALYRNDRDTADALLAAAQQDHEREEKLKDRLYRQIGQLQVELDWLKKKVGEDG